MKRVVLASFIALLIIGSIAASYFYYQQVQSPQSEAINAIPSDAALILELKNTKASWLKISQSQIWKELNGLAYFKNISNSLHLLDSVLLTTKNPEFFEQSQLFISAHPTSGNQYEMLFLFNLPKMQQESFVNDLSETMFQEQYKMTKETYNGTILHKIQIHEKTLTLSVCKGVFLASFSPALIEDGISQLKVGRSIVYDLFFKQVYSATGNKVDANLYINYKILPKLFLAGLVSPLKKPMVLGINSLSDFSEWGGLDLTIKQNGLMFNGFSTATDSGDFLSIFSGMKTQTIEMKRILPQKTAFMLYMGFTNVHSYLSKYKTHLSKNKNNSSIIDSMKEMNVKLGLDVEQEMNAWIDNEMALVITESGEEDFKNHVYAIIKYKKLSDAKAFFKKINKTQNVKESTKEELYRDYPIGFVDVPNLLPNVFGPLYGKLEKTYYTIIDDFVIIGNQASAIRKFIDDNRDRKLLIKDQGFNSMGEFTEAKTNLYLYLNIPRAMSLMHGLASPELASAMEANASYFHKFTNLALQYRWNGSKFYNNMYVQQASVKKYESKGLYPFWEAKLDSTLQSKPFIVQNHKTGSTEILVQDDANALYLLDSSGVVLWKVQLQERIMSEIYQVDAFKNKRLQYVFNTQSAIFIIDRNGENIDHFPIRLKYKATNGLSIFDYENNHDYRIYLAGDDHLIHAFQITGKPIEGWKFSSQIGTVTQPVMHTRIDEDDYLLVNDVEGSLNIVDRKGKTKINLNEPFDKVLKNQLFFEKENEFDKAHWVSTDSTGNLVKIYLDGHVTMKKTRSYSSTHFFNCMDIDGDGNNEYLFLDKKNLQVFSKDFSQVYSYVFKNEITTKPILCSFPENKIHIGIVSSKSNQLFLFNPDGTIYNGFPIKGNTPFSFYPANDSTFSIAIGGAESNVLFYNFK
jgi:hypothetical protein